MTTPAGWYDDGSGRQRWWDGTQWTEFVNGPAPAPAAAQPETTVTGVPADDGVAATVPQSGTPQEAVFAPPYVLPEQTTSWSPAVPSPDTMAGATPNGYNLGYGYTAAPAPARPRVSVLGLVGLCLVAVGIVLSFIPPARFAGWAILGAGFLVSIVSLFVRGSKWPGITGLAASIPGAVLAVAVMLISTSTSPTPFAEASPGPTAPAPSSSSSTPTPPAEVEGSETIYVGDLTVGDCLPSVEWAEEVTDVTVVPCDQPHTDEVYLVTELPDGDYPGDTELQSRADEICVPAFEEFVGIDYDDSALDYYWYIPTKVSWSRFGDRKIHCLAFSYDDVTGTLKGAAY